MGESFNMGKDDLQMSYVFVIIFVKMFCFAFTQLVMEYIHPCWGDYNLVSCISFSTQDPFALRMLRAFHLPDEGSPWQTQSNGVKRGESIFKKFKTKWEDIFLFFFFGLRFQYVGMSLKLNAPAKKGKFTDKKKEKEKEKAREVPQASGRFKCLANRWSYCSSLWDFRNPSQKKKEKKEKQNGVEADTSMTLCWKAPWSLTFGGLSTSSEVERLVPSSHATAEEEETVLVYVWIHVNTMTFWLGMQGIGFCRNANIFCRYKCMHIFSPPHWRGHQASILFQIFVPAPAFQVCPCPLEQSYKG